MKRFLLLLIVMLGCTIIVQSQNEVRFSQKNTALGYYNPASAGRSSNLDVMAMYNLGMLGWENAPKTFLIVADIDRKSTRLNSSH